MNRTNWHVLQSKKAFSTPFWDVCKDVCQTTSGKKLEYFYIKRPLAVGIVAFTADRKIILERNYRHPIKSWIIGIPAGIVEAGEGCKAAVQRELLEETGYQVKNIKRLISLYFNPGILNQKFKLYIGFGAEKVRVPQRDEAESIEVFEIEFDKAIRMAVEGRVENLEEVAAILIAQEYIKKYGFKIS